MRVAFVETAPFGGLLHYVAQLADAVARRGADVDLIVSKDNELMARGGGAATMRPILTPPVRDRDAQPRRALARFARRASIAVRLTRCWAQAVRAARSGHYDVVVINSDIYYSVVALALLGLTSTPGAPPVIFICHNARPFSRGRDGRLTGVSSLQRRLFGRLFPRLALVLVHGESSRKEFEESWPGVPLATIPHGDERLFAEQPPPPADGERILFFGIWRRVKGIEVLIEAFDRIAAQRPDAGLTLAGTPFPEDLDLEALESWAHGHGERVEVIGRYIPVEEVPSLFARARVVALPYLHAFQSGVVHLAMTMERPVVASDVGDLPTAISDGETGLLVPAGDAEALAAALERLLDDPAEAERMGAAGRKRVLSGSSWEVVAERFEDVVSSALAASTASAPGRAA